MAGFTLDVTRPDINKFVSNLGGIIGKDSLKRAANAAAFEMAYTTQERLRSATPVLTGKLKDAWEVQATTDGYRVVNTNKLPPVKWLIEGQHVSPYTIEPKVRGKYPLRFTVNGSEIRTFIVFRTGQNKPNAALQAVWEDLSRRAPLNAQYLKSFIRGAL